MAFDSFSLFLLCLFGNFYGDRLLWHRIVKFNLSLHSRFLISNKFCACGISKYVGHVCGRVRPRTTARSHKHICPGPVKCFATFSDFARLKAKRRAFWWKFLNSFWMPLSFVAKALCNRMKFYARRWGKGSESGQETKSG